MTVRNMTKVQQSTLIAALWLITRKAKVIIYVCVECMVSPNRFKERLGSKFMLNPLPHIRLGLLLSLSNFTNVSIVISEKIILINTLHRVRHLIKMQQ